MPDFAPSVTRLIDEFKRLPGIGQKTAQRLAFFLLRSDRDQALALSDAIRDAKEKIRECSVCSNITENDPCHFCTGASRDKKIICVVEEAHNIMAIEKTRMYSGMYHVLGGALSWTVPAFLANTFSAMQAAAADSATQVATGKDASILVILQMAGVPCGVDGGDEKSGYGGPHPEGDWGFGGRGDGTLARGFGADDLQETGAEHVGGRGVRSGIG